MKVKSEPDGLLCPRIFANNNDSSNNNSREAQQIVDLFFAAVLKRVKCVRVPRQRAKGVKG